MRIIDAEGEVQNYAYNAITLKPTGSSSFRITLQKLKDAFAVEILTWDGKISKNIYSKSINYNL